MTVIMNASETKYGFMEGLSSVEFYDKGNIKECSLIKKNELITPYGILVPQYQNEGVRNKYIKSLSLYENGNLKKIALQEQSTIETSIGPMKTELITFYESGKIKRLFPLNGKITGYWTEENEYELSIPQEFTFPFGKIKKRVIGILFYENGMIKSLTFWPKEVLMLTTPSGKLGVHYGIGMYPDGRLKSCEPAYPVLIDSPIGKLTAYDVNASGINGDKNSLNFNEDGSIKSLITSTDTIKMTKKNGETYLFEPGSRPSLLDEEGMDIIPLKVEFYENKIRINEKEENAFEIVEFNFTIKNNTLKKFNKCSDCSSCTECQV
ncbi:MAG: hypothetical protein WCD89_13565 [Anaerocolumna sp.]